MADFTSTTNFSLKKPVVGQAEDLWGVYINSNFDAIDQELQTLTDSITTPDLEGLGNVLNTTPATNDFLRFNGQSWAAATVTIPSSIDDLSDVDTSTASPTTGQALVWSGSSWTPSTPTAATITDGSISSAKLDTGLQTQIGRILVTDDDDSPTSNQILKYNSTSAIWEYADLPGSTVVTLSDVNSAALADDALLVYNSTAGEFQFESGATLRTTLGVDAAGTDNSTDLSISSATSYDYITLSAGQVLTINQVNLGTDVTGTLPVAQGGTGGTTASVARTNLLPSLTGNGSKLVAVNSGATDIEYIATSTLSITESQISDFGTYQAADAGLTSIAGLTTVADRMLYTTASDTYAVTTLTSAGRALLDDADAAAQRTTLGLGALATQDTITESQISDLQSYITASSTDTLTNKSGNISMFTNDAGYLTAETNNLSTVSGTLGTANGGTGVTALSSLNAADLGSNNGATNATDGYVLTADGTGGTAWEAATGGGGSGSSYIEHSSTVSDSLAISSGTNRMYIGNTAFSGSGDMEGYLVISHGYANFTGASALNITGTLNVVS